MLATPTAHTLEVPGARLHYELRGSGPLLLLIGAPMGGTFFAGLAEQLAGDHTVLTYDPRGISRSALTGPVAEDTPQLRADDVRALIEAAGGGRADVFGSSGGAVTGLALAQRHPELVRTLVAHEPPLTDLLPDAAEQRAWADELYRTYTEEGPDAAFGKFLAGIGVDLGEVVPPELPAPALAEMRANNTYFFGQMILGTTRYQPDIAALRSAPARIVIGVGTTNPDQITQRTSRALAELLGTTVVAFPGDHGGFVGQPAEFAQVLRVFV